MNPLRSVGARLSLALLIVVAGCLALVYLVVIPSLESQLIDSKISQLEQAGRTLAPTALAHTKDDPSGNLWWEPQGQAVNARLVMYRVLTHDPLSLLVIQDSHGLRNSSDVAGDPLAPRASALGEKVLVRPIHATVHRGGERFVEVAVPFADGQVLLLSASLSDTLDAVSVAKRRLLIAGGIALIAVFLVGYAATWLFARRIKRLKHAAELIAGGYFDEPIVDKGRDEVGEVARAFDDMRRRLSQLDRARREFIANASHELRTPLFSLGGFLELMDDEELEAETRREFLATMRGQVGRLTKLTLELLDLSRLDAGQMDVGREPVALAELARVVVDEFTAVAQQKGHVLVRDFDGGAVALADEQRVVQIARILVENALVHTPAGTHVQVRVGRSGSTVSFTVVDNGPGILPEQARHVFDRFYRADGSQTSGSGLGLAIALELARLMEGTVELESRVGRTSFRLVLPCADVAEQSVPAPRERVGV